MTNNTREIKVGDTIRFPAKAGDAHIIVYRKVKRITGKYYVVNYRGNARYMVHNLEVLGVRRFIGE